MKKIFFYVILMMISVHAHASSFDHGIWDNLLKKHVVSIRQGQATQVNYGGFIRDRMQLKTYLAAMSAVPRTTFDKWDNRMVWHIQRIIGIYRNFFAVFRHIDIAGHTQ